MSVILNGRVFHTGDSITFNKKAEGICYAPEGLKVYIHRIENNHVGLYSPDERIPHWHDMDGDVGEHRGYWIGPQELEMCIVEGSREYEISGDIEHRGVKLKGKRCKLLASLRDHLVFVEFDEHIGGCSADGLGKAGHCIAVKSNAITGVSKKSAKQ